MSAGAKQFVWGSGSDRVEELVGLDFYDASVTRLLAVVEIHGNPAKVFRIAEDSEGWDLAASWAGFDCSYTIFLAPRTTLEQAVEYAGRF